MDQKKQKSTWRGGNGHIRLIWLLLIGIAVYLLWERIVEMAEEFAFEMLAGTGDTPIMKLLRVYTGPLISVLGGIGTIAIFSFLKDRLHGEEENEPFEIRSLLKWFCVGFAGAIAGTVICLLADSLRLTLPLSEPVFSLSTVLALPVCFVVTLAGEVFMMEYIYESARLHLKRVFCIILVICIEFLEQRAWRLGGVGMVNVALKALVCCLMHVTVGLAATTGLWFGWGFVLSALFGLSGCAWTVYHVSEAWLTGGNLGLFCGITATVFMLAVIAYLYFRYFRKKTGA